MAHAPCPRSNGGLQRRRAPCKGGSGAARRRVIAMHRHLMSLCIAAIFTTTDNGRLRGHAGASLGKTDLAVAINEMLKRRSVAEWLRRGPVGRASWTPALQISTYCSREFGTQSKV